MNLAAAIAFITVMLLGMGGLTWAVYWDRRRTQPSPAGDPLDADTWPPPATVYDATILELGDPTHIDFTPPAFAW